MTMRRGRAMAVVLGASVLLAGCFPYTPSEMRPPADAPAPPAASVGAQNP